MTERGESDKHAPSIEELKAWRAAHWDGPFNEAKDRLCDALLARVPPTEPMDAQWCNDAFWRVNPGCNATVPSLYLLDFAREVLCVYGARPSPIAAIEVCPQGHRYAFLPDHPRTSNGDYKLCPHCVSAPSATLRMPPSDMAMVHARRFATADNWRGVMARELLRLNAPSTIGEAEEIARQK